MPGKKCLADLYNMIEVRPQNIAYTATLVCLILFPSPLSHAGWEARFVLSGRDTWSIEDGNFHAGKFFDSIISLFDDNAWAEATLTWWNE